MPDLPDPETLLDVLRVRCARTRETAGRELTPEEKAHHLRTDILHRHRVGSDCYRRIESLGDFGKESQQVGGALCNR